MARVPLPDELEDEPWSGGAASSSDGNGIALPLPMEFFASTAARVRNIPLPDELDDVESIDSGDEQVCCSKNCMALPAIKASYAVWSASDHVREEQDCEMYRQVKDMVTTAKNESVPRVRHSYKYFLNPVCRNAFQQLWQCSNSK
eukprot:7325405-Karenia_brevis.AAC.1